MYTTSIITFRNSVITKKELDDIQHLFFKKTHLVMIYEGRDNDVLYGDVGAVMTLDAFHHFLWMLESTFYSERFVDLSYRVNDRVKNHESKRFSRTPKNLQDRFHDIRNAMGDVITGNFVVQQGDLLYLIN